MFRKHLVGAVVLLSAVGLTPVAQDKGDVPPYKRVLNPAQAKQVKELDKEIAKLKAMLRKAAQRTITGLWRALGELVGCFTANECQNYFANAGYDAD